MHCRSRHLCNDYARPVYPSEEGIYYPIERIEVSPHHAIDLGFYVHEFTEDAIIHILRRFRIDWNKDIELADPSKNHSLKRTYIAHVISIYGANNGACLEPVTRKHKPRW